MYADRFTAQIDACVLAGGLHRNLILSLAEIGLFRPRWNSRSLDEMERAIKKITNEAADTTKQRIAIETAFPEGLVEGDPVIENALILPDPDDRHVLAAAIMTNAQVIVTDNTKDFPDTALKPYGIEAICTDEFIADTVELDPGAAMAAIKAMRERFRCPEIDADELIRRVEARNLFKTADLMGNYRELL